MFYSVFEITMNQLIKTETHFPDTKTLEKFTLRLHKVETSNSQFETKINVLIILQACFFS